MTEITINDFNDLEDSLLWIEHELFERAMDHNYVKGEVLLLPDGRWRVSVMYGDGQIEMDFRKDYNDSK